MKLFWKILAGTVLAATLSFGASAAEAEIPDEALQNLNTAAEKEISILCVGNSILAHGPSEAIGWSGNWGMAASSADKDYYHILQKKAVDAGYKNIVWSRAGVSSLERKIDKRLDYDYAAEINSGLASAVKSAVPDVVIFQIGENVNQSPSRASYKNAMIKLAEFCKSVNPDVDIIFCKPFWGGDAKNNGVKDAAIELGFTYADLASLNADKYKAIGLFTHSGVAAHPGDFGMQCIADLMFEQLNIILEKKYVADDKVAVQLNGQYKTFDVSARLIDGVAMVPLRAVCEALDATVEWNEESRTVSVTAPASRVQLKIGDKTYTKNKKQLTLDAPALIVDSRTLIPLNAFADIVNCETRYDTEKRVALIIVPEEKPVIITKIDGDSCDNPEKSGFYGGTSKLVVTSDEGSSNKYINVECTSKSKVWTYLWSKLDMKPGTIYVIEAEAKLLDKDGAGNPVEKTGIGFCMRYDGKDHSVKVTEVKVSDGWVRLRAEYRVPDSMVPDYDDDRFGIYANPVNDVGASFAVDNITVKPKS